MVISKRANGKYNPLAAGTTGENKNSNDINDNSTTKNRKQQQQQQQQYRYNSPFLTINQTFDSKDIVQKVYDDFKLPIIRRQKKSNVRIIVHFILFVFIVLLMAYVFQSKKLLLLNDMIHYDSLIIESLVENDNNITTQQKLDGLVVFYHIYIPPRNHSIDESNEQSLVYTIVKEQLQQVSTSYAAMISKNKLNVYYNTISNDTTASDIEWIQNICNNITTTTITTKMNCIHAKQYQTGFEDVTLNSIKSYCNSNSNSNHTIIYIHNKGSYHPNTEQRNWRISLTAAVTSKECIYNMLYTNSKCTVCGLLFQPLPSLHFPGNMWISKCSYINKLYTTQEYHTKLLLVQEWIQQQKQQHTFSAQLFPYEDHYIGLNRYVYEQWIGSHPINFIPCDVSAVTNLKYWLQPQRIPKPNSTLIGNVIEVLRFRPSIIPITDRIQQQFTFSLAPRYRINDDWIYYSYTKIKDIILVDDSTYQNNNTYVSFRNTNSSSINNDLITLRMYDYFLLRGLLARYYFIYNQYPSTGITNMNNTNRSSVALSSSSSSWIWSWYPDGEKWKTLIEQYGVDIDGVISSQVLDIAVDGIQLPINFNTTTYSNRYIQKNQKLRTRFLYAIDQIKLYFTFPT